MKNKECNFGSAGYLLLTSEESPIFQLSNASHCIVIKWDEGQSLKSVYRLQQHLVQLQNKMKTITKTNDGLWRLDSAKQTRSYPEHETIKQSTHKILAWISQMKLCKRCCSRFSSFNNTCRIGSTGLYLYFSFLILYMHEKKQMNRIQTLAAVGTGLTVLATQSYSLRFVFHLYTQKKGFMYFLWQTKN